MPALLRHSAGRPIDLLSLGNPNIDLVIGVGQVPLADQKCLGQRLGIFAGGTTANVACAASRLGARTQVFGQIGDDAEGQFLKAEFERFDVSTAHLRVAAGTRSALAVVMVDGQGEKALVYVPMPDGHGREPVPIELFAQSRVVYAMPYDIEAFVNMAREAHVQGADVVIDVEPAMVPDSEHLGALLTLADIMFLSDSSFRAIFAAEPTNELMRRLLEKGPRAMVVTLGAAGALAVTREELVRQHGFPAQVVDSTGAGDCFIGALLAAILEGQSLQEALRFGCAAASISLTAIGARTLLPDRAAVASLLKKYAD